MIEGSFVLCFFARTSPMPYTFCCALCRTQMPLQTIPWRFTQGVVLALLQLPRCHFSAWQTPFFCLHRGKNPRSSCQMCGEGWKNNPSNQTALLLCPLLNQCQVHHKIIQKCINPFFPLTTFLDGFR